MNDLQGARTRHEHVLAIREETLGVEHSDTATSHSCRDRLLQLSRWATSLEPKLGTSRPLQAT